MRATDHRFDDPIEIEVCEYRVIDFGQRRERGELAAEARRHRVERLRELAELVVGGNVDARREVPARRATRRRHGTLFAHRHVEAATRTPLLP